MKIEEVEALEAKRRSDQVYGELTTRQRGCMVDDLLSALRAEAWHPIEKAAELGAKDGQYVLVWDGSDWYEKRWRKFPLRTEFEGVTHFRFINPPEGA